MKSLEQQMEAAYKSMVEAMSEYPQKVAIMAAIQLIGTIAINADEESRISIANILSEDAHRIAENQARPEYEH